MRDVPAQWPTPTKVLLATVLAITCLTGCGRSDWTLAVGNDHRDEYVIRLTGAISRDTVVPPKSGGFVARLPGAFEGQIQVLDAACAIIHTFTTPPRVGDALLLIDLNGAVSLGRDDDPTLEGEGLPSTDRCQASPQAP